MLFSFLHGKLQTLNILGIIFVLTSTWAATNNDHRMLITTEIKIKILDLVKLILTDKHALNKLSKFSNYKS